MLRMLEVAKQSVRRRQAATLTGEAADSALGATSGPEEHRKTLGDTVSKKAKDLGNKNTTSNVLNAKDNQQEFVRHYFHVIKRFVYDKTKYELEMPHLDGFDRLVVHTIADQCNLSHSSTGIGEKRTLRLKKDELFFQHQDAVERVNVEDIIAKVSGKESKYHIRRVIMKPNERRALEAGQLGSYGDEEVLQKVQRFRRATDEYLYATDMGYTNEELTEEQQHLQLGEANPNSIEERLRQGAASRSDADGGAVSGSVRRITDIIAGRATTAAPLSTTQGASSVPPSTASKGPEGAVSEKGDIQYVEVCRGCASRVTVDYPIRQWRCEKFCALCSRISIWYLDEQPASSSAGLLTSGRKRTHEETVPSADSNAIGMTSQAAPEEIDLDLEDDEVLLLEDAMDLVAMNDFSAADSNWLRKFANAVMQFNQDRADTSSGSNAYSGKVVGLQDHLVFCIDFQDILHLNIFRRYDRLVRTMKKEDDSGNVTQESKRRRTEEVSAPAMKNTPHPNAPSVLYLVIREHKGIQKGLTELVEAALQAAFVSDSEAQATATPSLESLVPHIAVALPNVSVYGVEATAICQLRTTPLHVIDSAVEHHQHSTKVLNMDNLLSLQREYGQDHFFLADNLELAIDKGSSLSSYE